MSDKTVVRHMEGPGWSVYRIETESSRYALSVYPGFAGKRPLAVLRGHSQATGRDLEVQDGAPLIGGKSLFLVPPRLWVGGRLEIGSVVTSPIQSVVEERSTEASAVPAPSAPPPEVRPRSPSPPTQHPLEDLVERVEVAAGLLRKVFRHPRLLEELAGDEDLLERYQVGLSECLLMVRVLAARLRPRV